MNQKKITIFLCFLLKLYPACILGHPLHSGFDTGPLFIYNRGYTRKRAMLSIYWLLVIIFAHITTYIYSYHKENCTHIPQPFAYPEKVENSNQIYRREKKKYNNLLMLVILNG